MLQFLNLGEKLRKQKSGCESKCELEEACYKKNTMTSSTSKCFKPRTEEVDKLKSVAAVVLMAKRKAPPHLFPFRSKGGGKGERMKIEEKERKKDCHRSRGPRRARERMIEMRDSKQEIE